VYTKRLIESARWLLIAIALAGIVALYHHFSRANETTVALTLLLLVLVLAGNWGLRYAVAASIAAAVLFNYFFLPPIGTFAIADTQNWVALLAFIGTAIYASHLASRIREESEEANARRRESEMLYRLGRQLLQPERVAQLERDLPDQGLPVIATHASPMADLYKAWVGVMQLSYLLMLSVALIPAGRLADVWGGLRLYRTGLVKVGHRFFMTTLVVTLGLLVVMMAAWLTGWGMSGMSGLLIFGVLYLIIAVMNLFVDFSFVDRAEAAHLDADAEWFSAFTILISSVMVYLALLRIFGGSR